MTLLSHWFNNVLSLAYIWTSSPVTNKCFNLKDLKHIFVVTFNQSYLNTYKDSQSLRGSALYCVKRRGVLGST